MKEKYFYKFVDELMKDGKERNSACIIENLKVSMSTIDVHGRSRVGRYVPVQRRLTYYMRINKNYVHLNKDTRNPTWKMVLI